MCGKATDLSLFQSDINYKSFVIYIWFRQSYCVVKNIIHILLTLSSFYRLLVYLFMSVLHNFIKIMIVFKVIWLWIIIYLYNSQLKSTSIAGFFSICLGTLKRKRILQLFAEYTKLTWEQKFCQSSADYRNEKLL